MLAGKSRATGSIWPALGSNCCGNCGVGAAVNRDRLSPDSPTTELLKLVVVVNACGCVALVCVGSTYGRAGPARTTARGLVPRVCESAKVLTDMYWLGLDATIVPP